MAHASSVVLTFGPPGTGKSTDLVQLGAANWAFFSPPGGLRVASVVGIDLTGRHWEVRYAEDVVNVMPWVVQQGFAGIAIDDLTGLLKNSLNRIKSGYALWKREPTPFLPDGTVRPDVWKDGENYYKQVGWDRALWSYHEALVKDKLATQARYLGIHVAATGHVQEPFSDAEERRHRGGMDVAWKKMTPELIYIADAVQLAVPRPSEGDDADHAWDTRINCDENHPDMALKDRHDVLPSRFGPLNTAEALREYARVSGSVIHQIPRPKGLEWIEDFAEKFARRVVKEGLPEADVRAAAKEVLLRRNTPSVYATWAIRDGVHRARLRMHRKNAYNRI